MQVSIEPIWRWRLPALRLSFWLSRRLSPCSSASAPKKRFVWRRRVSRVTPLGELTASIAHEVNQPLAAVVANAEACLRWLDRGTPDLDEARRSVERIVKDAKRAAEVIRRVRALAKKTDIETVALDVNDIVSEVIALVQHEL